MELEQQPELTFEQFIKQRIAESDAVISAKEEAFKAKNRIHFKEIAALRAKQQPFRKLIADYKKIKNGIDPTVKKTRAKRTPKA